MIIEALATARAQPVSSVVSIVIVAGMVGAVLLTTGRTVGAEQAVLNSIDSAGTRSIVIRAEGDAGLDTSVLERIGNIDGIAWSGVFSSVQDVTNAAVPGGTTVPARLAWSDQLGELGLPAAQAVQNRTAWASNAALDQLGMPDATGGVVTGAGAEFAIAGRIPVPDYLRFLEPLIVAPQQIDSDDPHTVSILVVIAERPDLVSPVSQVVLSVLAVDDPTKVTLTTSEGLATLRALIEGQLGSFGRNLVIVIFALTASLVAAILYGFVMLRRKDFGRRRALGASQGLIIGLLLTQMAFLSGIGAVIGCAATAISLVITGDPLPGIAFFVAVSVLAIAVGVIAALLPASVAARRDPLAELRVP
ncbi:hypothetical protein CLE01_10800 [Cryobacterium levicorallinum]|nr:hypothetical protein CLE01_10800 [Cryobacterium levicorallinum]